MRLFRSSRRRRLFILGLDGSPLPLLRRLMSAGDLPNLARVFEMGSAVEMSSSLPDVSAVAWTSINTGVNPAKHGIFGFVDRRPRTGTLEVMTAAHTRAPTLWQLVSAAGRRAIAVNVPLSYPPQRINGMVISDFLAPSLEKAVYPLSVLPQLQSIGYRIDTDPWAARQSLDAFIEDFKVTADRRAEAVLYLMKSEEWDLFHVVFMETDRLHHFMWRYMEEDDQNYAPKFVDAYRQIDSLAGKIINELSDEDKLIVLSDHGFTTLKREVYLNVWLEQQGYLKFRADAKRGLESIEPSSTVFALDPGRIYVNMAGREPIGSVSQSEVAALIEDVSQNLAGLTDPESGEPIVRNIYRADDIYQGPYRDRAPDLLVMPHDGYDIKGTFDATELTGQGPLVGMHKYDNATLFVRGQILTVNHASVHDVLPTACSLLGLDCPSNLDGRVLIAS